MIEVASTGIITGANREHPSADFPLASMERRNGDRDQNFRPE
jgi:hypothetical protein